MFLSSDIDSDEYWRKEYMNKDCKYEVERDPETLKYKITKWNGTVGTVKTYVEKRSPNKADLKEMLEHAKGPDRTMAEFAEDCSDKSVCELNAKVIAPPVFSRIVKGVGLKRPLKPAIVQAILNNAADKDFVTPENLMRANGLDEEREESQSEPELKPFYGYSRAKNDRAVSDLKKALQGKGYEAYRVIQSEQFNYVGKNVPFRDDTADKYDLNMDFDEVLRVTDKKGKKFLWGFVIDGTEPEDIGRGEVIIENLYYEGYYRSKDDAEDDVDDNVIDKNGRILLRALIDPASLKGIKISFVCQNRFWYNLAVEALKDIKVDAYISVVLIQDYKVVSEFTLSNKKDKRPKCILGEFREQDNEDRYECDVMDIDGKTERIMNPPLGY